MRVVLDWETEKVLVKCTAQWVSEGCGKQKMKGYRKHNGSLFDACDVSYLTVIVKLFEAPAPGLVATIFPEPAAARSLAGMATER